MWTGLFRAFTRTEKKNLNNTLMLREKPKEKNKHDYFFLKNSQLADLMMRAIMEKFLLPQSYWQKEEGRWLLRHREQTASTEINFRIGSAKLK